MSTPTGTDLLERILNHLRDMKCVRIHHSVFVRVHSPLAGMNDEKSHGDKSQPEYRYCPNRGDIMAIVEELCTSDPSFGRVVKSSSETVHRWLQSQLRDVCDDRFPDLTATHGYYIDPPVRMTIQLRWLENKQVIVETPFSRFSSANPFRGM